MLSLIKGRRLQEYRCAVPEWGNIRRLAMLWLTRHEERRALRDPDDHLLRDIGLSAGAAESEARRKFWRGTPRDS